MLERTCQASQGAKFEATSTVWILRCVHKNCALHISTGDGLVALVFFKFNLAMACLFK